MVINIRGTSGAGKSTLVRHILSFYKHNKPVYVNGRKQPLYYIYSDPNAERELAVLGHYESPCGGCDTIKTMDEVFAMVKEHNEKGRDVLFEGLLLGVDFKRTIEIPDIQIIHLDLPIELCVESINERRRARGKMEPVNPKNTESKHKGVRNVMKRLREAGITVHTCETREQAQQLVEEMLGL